MIRLAEKLISFSRYKKFKPRIILLVQFHNEIERMPDFFTNVLPHVDGIIGLNDGSTDRSSQYFSRQPKVLRVINRPIRNPHIWDEPTNRQELIQASHEYCPDWLLALDMDERVENNFRQKLNWRLRVADLLRLSKISFNLVELWDSENTYRIDGIWGKKRRTRLFRWTDDHQIANIAFHGPWTSTHHLTRKVFHSGLRIYHLGTISDTLRIKRIEKYKLLDPHNQYQTIGYDYLNNKKGLRIQQIEANRHFIAEDYSLKATHKVCLNICITVFKKIFPPEITLFSGGDKYVSQEKIICRINKCLDLIPKVANRRNISSVIISGWPRTGKTILATRLCRSMDLFHLPLDGFSAIYEKIEDDRTRKFIKENLIKNLLNRFPFGVILEGSDLIFNNYYRSSNRPVKSLALLSSLFYQHQVYIYVLGNAEETIEEKAYALWAYRQKHKCWTSHSVYWDEDHLLMRAKETIEVSQYFQSHTGKINYIDLQSNNFFASLIRAEAKIQEQIIDPFKLR